MSLPGGRRRYLYARTRAEAAERLVAAQKAAQDGLPSPSGKQTVASFLSEWLEAAKPNLGPRTWTRYEQLCRVHIVPEVGRVRLSHLQPQHLQTMYARRLDHVGPRTVGHVHRCLHTALAQAARWGVVVRNVATLVDPPRVPHREMKWLTAEQIKALLAAANGHRYEAL